jgi:hypothetical protein
VAKVQALIGVLTVVWLEDMIGTVMGAAKARHAILLAWQGLLTHFIFTRKKRRVMSSEDFSAP